MCNVTVPVLSSNIQSLTLEAVCVALIVTCFGSLSPKDNVPETLTFWFVVIIVESCLIVTSVAGSCWAVGSSLGGTLHSKGTFIRI